MKVPNMYPYSYFTKINPNSEPTVEISEQRLRDLLQPMVSQIEVDETWYRRNNPDVDQAIKSRAFGSASEHYRQAGYFENRLPRALTVDEAWYLKEYPDVTAAISRGIFASAAEHFTADGFKEGRSPYQGWSLIRATGEKKVREKVAAS